MGNPLIGLLVMLAAIWYVKPTGSGDGTSYGNAWGGMDAISGLSPGDTLYLCGLFSDTNQAALLTNSMTIRGDYPGDVGIISGGELWFIGNSNIVFQSITWSNATATSTLIASTNTTYITFSSCLFTNGAQADLYYGQDYWTFSGCEFGNLPNGIYTHINSQPRGPDYLTVTNCYIHDCDTVEYPHQDGHAIGLQGSSFCTLTRNTIERTGSAIEFWTTTIGLSNNVVSYNYIKDIHKASVTLGHGIGFSANANGWAVSNRVYGNIIENVGLLKTDTTAGYGVAFNRDDWIGIWNNTITNCTRGVSLSSSTAECNAQIENNIIESASQYYVSFTGEASPGDVTINYNLYYPTNTSYLPTGTHNANSITADPLFAPGSFRLLSSSPARGAGTDVGLSVDYAGRAWRNPPSIGAYEYGANATAATAHAATLK